MYEAKTIMIADDHPLMIEGLISIIHQYTPFMVIGSMNDGLSLLEKLKSVMPDMVLIDLNMPKLNGIETARMVKNAFAAVKIVCISMYSDRMIYDELIKIGVDGFIPKLTDADIFADTITSVMNGEKRFIHLHINAQKSGEIRNDHFQDILKLSEKEIEVIRLIKKGMTTKLIAEQLNRSEYTIETHRKNICKKLNINSPNGLYKFILEHEV